MNSWIKRYRLLMLFTVVCGTCLIGSPSADELISLIENARGTVVQVGSFGYGIVPNEDPGTRYAPIEPLPEAFQQDGLKVVFSGEIGDADDVQGRRWGTPLRVTAIELQDDPALAAGDGGSDDGNRDR